jgi:hypothetical protein
MAPSIKLLVLTAALLLLPIASGSRCDTTARSNRDCNLCKIGDNQHCQVGCGTAEGPCHWEVTTGVDDSPCLCTECAGSNGGGGKGGGPHGGRFLR